MTSQTIILTEMTERDVPFLLDLWNRHEVMQMNSRFWYGHEVMALSKSSIIKYLKRQVNQARKNIPSGHFIHADAGSVDFPEVSFAAVVSFYALEHLPREEHKKLFQKIYNWLQTGGYLLISTEAEEVEGVVSEWLGVPMFFSSYGPETIKQFIQDVGFDLLEVAIEEQTEGPTVIPYLWIFAQKPRAG